MNLTITLSFHVCNGVKQGAVISPILFAVYYDEFIAKLARSGYGCLISQHVVGALSVHYCTFIVVRINDTHTHSIKCFEMQDTNEKLRLTCRVTAAHCH